MKSWDTKVRKRGLRTRIVVWSFIPTILILAAVVIIMFQAYDKVAEELVIERNRDVTRLTAINLATELADYTEIIRTQANIISAISDDPIAIAAETTEENALPRLFLFDAGGLLLDNFGIVMSAVPNRPLAIGQNWADRSYINTILNSGVSALSEPVFSDIVGDGPGGTKVIVIALPITGVQGELFGVLTGMFHVSPTSANAFYGSIAKHRIGKNRKAYIVDGNGRIIYHTDTDLIGADITPQLTELQALGGTAGATRTRDSNGKDIIASFAPVPSTPWNLVVEESWASVISSSQGYRYILFALLALGLIIPTVIVTFGVRRIMGPIKDIRQGVQRITGGDFDYTVTAQTGDEIQDLAERFNDMASSLKSSYGKLEEKIEEVTDRTRELEKLEQLGRAIIHAPPDASTLPDLLIAHVPDMFKKSQIEIKVFPDHDILHYPDNWSPVVSAAWEWLRTVSDAQWFLPGAVLPWDEQPINTGVIIAPIIDAERAEVIGGIYISQQHEPNAIGSLLPAVQSLAAQIASTLHSAKNYEKILAHYRVSQELATAWRIQASFLPSDLPQITGWQLAVTLKPARETSGDFYDIIPLPNGRLGIVIADVADKGVGSALYMALARTLIRTYATEYELEPELVLTATNRRLLTDVHYNMFVTVFYGILDLATGILTYCNAGHDPPYLISAQKDGTFHELRRTGIALGVYENLNWKRESAQITKGDTLLLYTDGVTEAQDIQGLLFGKERCLKALQANRGRSAQEIQDTLIKEIQQFVRGAPQFDDIALMVIVRGLSS